MMAHRVSAILFVVSVSVLCVQGLLPNQNRKKRSADSVYEQIAQSSGGNVFNTDKTNVSQVAGIIKDSAHAYVLLAAFSMSSSDANSNLQVDNTVSHVKIRIMETTKQAKPIVKLYYPQGTPILVSEDYLGNGALEMVIPASQQYGEWRLQKQDTHNWDVSVYGETIVDFSVMFLETHAVTGYSMQMEGRPIIGATTPVVVQVSGEDKEGSVDDIVFMDEKGIVLYRSPVLPQGHRGDTFRAQTTIPSIPFRVGVEGKDKLGNTFKRAKMSFIKPSALDLKIQDIKGELEVHVEAVNRGSTYQKVSMSISDDQGLVAPPTNKTVYLWTGVSATVYFELQGGHAAGVSSNVMIKAAPVGASDNYQYVMRTFTVHASQK
ncbi:uncharacterized protein LOC124116773 isoform X2 [Haliotis rufescens]|uniref:uncharacterized protein LOC124116773 isoform X2 n=1 Tax=Haliotis rufescens TaxID=6454 RepID=UPI00201F2E6A|nr:uncharacterized protein LOC124116773 isoform X2 [Haliotis rufescens]